MELAKYVAPLARYLWLLGVAMVVVAVGISLRVPLQAALVYWWDRIGPVMIGLLPLSVLLCGIAVRLLHEPRERPLWMKKSLVVIGLAAPALGLLGTVLGAMESAQNFSLDNGVEALIENFSRMMRGLSMALGSTAWGTLLGVPAEILFATLFHEEPVGKGRVVVLHNNPAMPPARDFTDNEGGVR